MVNSMIFYEPLLQYESRLLVRESLMFEDIWSNIPHYDSQRTRQLQALHVL